MGSLPDAPDAVLGDSEGYPDQFPVSRFSVDQ